MGVRRRAGAVKRGALRRAALVASLSLLLPVAAEEVSASPRVEVTVMSQNLYLGSSLTPALTAPDAPAFVRAVAQIYGTMLFTNFPERAARIADTIAAEQPDVIGLQEVSNWVATPTRAGPTPPSFDFLTILRDQLAARGLDYEVAAVSNNAHIGPAPLVFPFPPIGCNEPPSTTPTSFDCVVELYDRDVILVNADTPGLEWSNARSGRFEAQATVAVPTGNPQMPTVEVSFDRGWAAINVTYRRRSFRFVDTHLEVEDFPAVQQAQAAELLAGPMRPGRALIAVGDFNSAADGSTTAAYDQLTRLWLQDLVPSPDPSYTCCQNGLLINPVSQLTQRIDLVLTHGAAHGIEAHLDTGAIADGGPPFWASDHAGVVATVEV
jgi:endonuclease/exonuclease/phosphatase family metal-dependent hydrolase